MCKKGTVFNLQRFSTYDGPGIRTVVFFKGCPLNCAWCHNPESKSLTKEIFYKEDLCIGCGGCEQVCPQNCHTLSAHEHLFERQNCLQCGGCANACTANSLELCGKEQSAEEVMELVLRDRPFYEESGGGLTLSGGEPLLQFDFALSLLQLAKKQGLHTAVETCGYTQKDLARLHPFVDLWLYDVKLFSSEDHEKYTGVSNRVILENLQKLDRMGAEIVLRCPIIPRVNDRESHFEQIARLVESLAHVTAIHLEPYHPLGISKAQQLGKKQAYEYPKFLEPENLELLAKTLQAKTGVDVVVM